MAKSTPTPEVPPSLSKEQGRRALQTMKEKGEKLLSNRPVSDASLDTWTDATVEFISKTFGSRSPYRLNFYGPVAVCVMGDGYTEQYEEYKRAETLSRRLEALVSIIDQIDTELTLLQPTTEPTAKPDTVVWSLLHAKVVHTAKPRFEAGHYADAVEAALKELNSIIKEMIRKKTGQELDGASLMLKAFSPNQPTLIALEDLSTETGKSIQEGFMHIFAGAMKGVRNPKAHANIEITKERCIHFLFLASLLFDTLDNRP